MEKIIDLLKELTTVNGVAGSEENIAKLLADKLKKYGEVKTDFMNNVYCTFGEGYHFLLDAHLDEIGMVVTAITDDGFIKFSNSGGVDRRMMSGYEVDIWGKKRIHGIISTLPPHLQSANDEKTVPKIEDLSIDVGMSAESVKEVVSLGDTITFKRNFTPLLNNCISSSCLDDRAGVLALLLTLDTLKALPCKVTVMFSSQEEVGQRGAKIGPYLKNVDEAIAVDVSFAYTPNCDKYECGILGDGAMIGFSPVLDKNISRKLVTCAKENNIPYQQEIMSSATSTNADYIAVSESGIKTALISIPQKYMHQPVEVVSIDDILSVSNLICAYIKDRVGELNA